MSKLLIFSWQQDVPMPLINDLTIKHKLLKTELHIFVNKEAVPEQGLISNNPHIKLILHHTETGLASRMEKMKEVLMEYLTPKDYCYIFSGDDYPQETHMLTHLCIQKAPERVKFFSEQEEEISYIQETPMDEHMATFNFYHHIHEFLESGNYLSAQQIISNRFQNKDINKLLEFGNNLFSLDLENKTHYGTDMFELLKSTLAEIDNDDEEIAYINHLKKLRNGSQKEFIYFLHNYASFLYEQEDLIDFVVLYYRLVEESLLYALGWDYKENYGGGNGFRFIKQSNRKFILPLRPREISRYFHHYLRVLKQEIRKIEKRYSGVFISNNRCEGLWKLNEKEKYFVEVYLAFNDAILNDFLDLRHEGVSGHGFADFTVEDFEEICGGISPLEKLEPLLEKLGLLPEHSIFDLVQKAVLGMLKEGYEWQQ